MPRRKKESPTTGIVGKPDLFAGAHDGAKLDEAGLTVTLVPTEIIDDNPYNAREAYPETEVKAMGESLQRFGLQQVPKGRKLPSGRYQIAYGHKRLRGFRWNRANTEGAPGSATDPRQWDVMPVILREISDADMFHFAMVENLERSDAKPIGLAQAIAKFSNDFPDVPDKDIAAAHHMTEANVSNMKRVLRLPPSMIGLIDEGVLSFTQGRELLRLSDEKMMALALQKREKLLLPNTVAGLKQAVDVVMKEEGPIELDGTKPADAGTAATIPFVQAGPMKPGTETKTPFLADSNGLANDKLPAAGETITASAETNSPKTEKPVLPGFGVAAGAEQGVEAGILAGVQVVAQKARENMVDWAADRAASHHGHLCGLVVLTLAKTFNLVLYPNSLIPEKWLAEWTPAWRGLTIEEIVKQMGLMPEDAAAKLLTKMLFYYLEQTAERRAGEKGLVNYALELMGVHPNAGATL